MLSAHDIVAARPYGAVDLLLLEEALKIQPQLKKSYPSYKVVVTVDEKQKSFIVQLRTWNMVPCDHKRCTHRYWRGSCFFLCPSTGTRPRLLEEQVGEGNRRECQDFIQGFEQAQSWGKLGLVGLLQREEWNRQQKFTPMFIEGLKAAQYYADQSAEDWCRRSITQFTPALECGSTRRT